MTTRRSEPRALTSWRVLLVVMAAVVATVVGGVAALQHQIQQRALDTATDGVVVLSTLVIDRNLTLNDITDRLHPENRSRLDADLVLLLQRGQLHGLMIWSVADGQLVYADPVHRYAGATGDTHRPDADLDRAVATPVTDSDTGEQLFQVNYPYDANGDDVVDALAVALLPRNGVDRTASASLRVLYAGGLFVFLLALGGVLQVRRRQITQDHAASHDWLTGLGNRERLRRITGPALAAATPERPLALLLLDLNGFKQVNDTLGHQAGDHLLTEVAGRLRDACAPDGTAIRLGGDEFAVLLPRCGPDAALTAGRALREAVRHPVLIDGVAVAVDASVGLACAPADGDDLSTLLHRADVAMYRAKKAGGGVLRHDPGADHPHGPAHPADLPDLRRALAEDRLELHYRQVYGGTGTVTALEAVLRWHHPRHGLQEAGQFLAAAERSPMIRSLTAWMLRTAAADCAGWRAAGHAVGVVVHLPAPLLGDPDLPEMITTTARVTGLPLWALGLDFGAAAPAADLPGTAPVLGLLGCAEVRGTGPAWPAADVPARLPGGDARSRSDDLEVVPR